MRLFRRLRTQLIVSHLIAIACTLIAMVTAVVLIAGSWFASQHNTLSEPTQEAQAVANAVSGLITPGSASQDLNSVLQALADGSLRLPGGPAYYAGWIGQRALAAGTALHDVDYIVVLSPSGEILGSSKPAGTTYKQSEQRAWDRLVQAAFSNPGSPQDLVYLQSDSQPAAYGAYPVLDTNKHAIAVVILASRVVPPAVTGSNFWHSLLIAAEASAALLLASSVFALISAGLVGYLLSRRLVSRLERLGHTAERLAEGDLSQRVEEGSADEVGQLARRFNAMAERLADMVSELKAARDRTEDTLIAKRELVANVSHELRTPLALIRGYVETLSGLASEMEPGQQREYLAVVERETENLSQLIDDLFALSTAEAGSLPMSLEPVSLSEVVQEVGDSLKPLAYRERQITIATNLPADLPRAIADRQRIVQILGNLVRNSLRYTPEGGLIVLRAERQEDWIAVLVEDTGEGIPPERLPHVFERFYRGDQARDRDSGGAGLGLAIVREMVEAMGGNVSVESQLGQGSCFTFRLPVEN